MIKIEILSEDAKMPKRANPTDAGADLFSTVNKKIPPHSSMKFPLGIKSEIPEGYAGFIFARSGLGTKHGVRPRNCVGVIDSKYRGEWMVVLENHSGDTYQVKKGDRIAQVVFMPVALDEFELTDSVDTEEDRGGGFGHTGV